MTNHQDKINQLLDKLETLLKRQDDFSKEINYLRVEIERLKTSEPEQPTDKAKPKPEKPIAEQGIETQQKTPEFAHQQQAHQQPQPEPLRQTVPPVNSPPAVKSDLEKFIGENLINKVGITITVIGVAIGAKYAIDNELISPLTRIILGYLVGSGLLAFALKLKKNYENFSAVLLSGAMAIMYFITYSAYSFYDLFPQAFAFALMVIITTFTAVAAITYNRQVIAHIGLVGAYAVPFLLGESPGNATVLFSYMAIINVGILVIAFKKYWKPLYYSSFGLTWLMFFVWYGFSYQTHAHFALALTFLTIFFGTFYTTFLAYKLLHKEKFEIDDIVLLLANSFIFYALGYDMLDGHSTGQHLLGAFTLCNAVVHLIVSGVIYSQKLADRNLFYLVSGLVLVFVTIAIPVQLDGSWVTLLWAGEAALIFWIGRTKKAPVYEVLSYPLMTLAFFSIGHDWLTGYNNYSVASPETRITPLFNINFLTSVLFIAAFGFINFLNRNTNYPSALEARKGMANLISYSIPAILLFAIYYAFRLEIANYWHQLYIDSALTINSDGQQYPQHFRNHDLPLFKTIWIINYSLFFIVLLAFVNFRKIKNQPLGMVNLALIVAALAVFLIQGLYALSELRESYLAQTLSQHYQQGIFNIGIRYISFVFVALALIACYKYVRQDYLKSAFREAFDYLLHISVLWIASSELIHWLDMADSAQAYKLGLSILWGIYSLLLIALGIWKKKKHLRVGAIAVFGVTLIKLFVYDISHLDTISKTIVFVSLGVLLLIISFLYNKYRLVISGEGGE